MLAIDLEGAQALLDLLQRMRAGHPASETELEEVLAANAFFVDFYSHWEGSDRETIRQAIGCFDQPERAPSGILPTRLAEGFRQATDEINLMRSRMSWLGEIDTSAIAERVLAFLPDNTPIDSVIHITVDLFNNAFVYKREMGVSLLKGATDRRTFEDAVTHELHHVCFHTWGARDAVRQTLLQEQSGRGGRSTGSWLSGMEMQYVVAHPWADIDSDGDFEDLRGIPLSWKASRSHPIIFSTPNFSIARQADRSLIYCP